MSISPLSKIVFIQKVALFAGSTPKKALQLIYVTPEWRETVLDFTFDVLLFDAFVKPLLQQQTPSTSVTEEEKEMEQQQNKKKKLELFQQFRKVVAFVFERVSAENKDLIVRMKNLLAVLFNFVHRKDNNNDDSNDDSNSVTNAGFQEEVASFLRAFSLCSFLRIEDLHDLIINHIAPRVTAIEEFASLICTIVQYQQSAELFCNVESFSAILKCFHRSKTSRDACFVTLSINNILNYNLSSNKLLNSLPVVEAFSFIIPLVNDEAAVRWISKALEKILDNNEEAQQKFGTAEFFQIFKGMEKHASTDESKKQFQTVFELLMKK
jgi:hypothetical protein